MTRRRNEDVVVLAACMDEDCEGFGVEQEVAGRYNAGGEFEPFGEDDVNCEECGNRKEFDGDE